MSSIFTKIINKEISSYIIAENSKFIAFLDIFPLKEGHVIIAPKQEIDYLFDIEDSLLSEMILFSKNISKSIKKSFECNRVGMSVIGLEVPHAHIHLIPIDSADDLNFTKTKLKLTEHKLQDICNLLKKNIN